MAQAARTVEMLIGPTRTEVRERFFKTDHPRAIDLYIDYFGGGADPLPLADEDACGDTLIERLA